jgi:hypothetical protein
MHVSLSKLTASEQQPAMTKVMKAQLEPLKGCYDLALNDTPTLKGELSLKFTLDAAQPSIVDISMDEHSALTDGTVSSCVMARLRSTTWPAPKKHADVAVTLKFELAR